MTPVPTMTAAPHPQRTTAEVRQKPSPPGIAVSVQSSARSFDCRGCSFRAGPSRLNPIGQRIKRLCRRLAEGVACHQKQCDGETNLAKLHFGPRGEILNDTKARKLSKITKCDMRRCCRCAVSRRLVKTAGYFVNPWRDRVSSRDPF